MNTVYDILYNTLRIDVEGFLSDVSLFFDNDQKIIYSYYSGDLTKINQSIFDNLDSLIERCDNILVAFESKKNSFNNTNFWNILEVCEDVKIRLESTKKLDKWCRSIKTVDGYRAMELSYILSQNQTLEDVSEKLGLTDPQNQWTDIAIKNKLYEDSYSKDGGNLLKVFLRNDSEIFIDSVVDNLSGLNILGKDLSLQICFVDDDLKCLEPKETAVQSAGILLGLVKGGNQEFPNDGIDKELLGKGNKYSFVYPSIMRQVVNTFKTDDTFSYITLESTKQEQDVVYMNFIISTILGDTIRRELQV